MMMEAPKPRGYLPIDGIAAYDNAVQGLVFGADSEPAQVRPRRHRAGARRHRRPEGRRRLPEAAQPDAKVLISDPSWENHRALFEGAGFEVDTYPYYDAATRGVDFDGMLAALSAAAAGTIVVLHACCHNPTGYDLTPDAVGPGDRTLSRRASLVPFLDMAYQGFGDGIAEDGAVVAPVRRRRPRLLRRDLVLEELLAVRRARRRALVVCASKDEADARAEPAEARDPHQLLQPADPRRAGRRRRC